MDETLDEITFVCREGINYTFRNDIYSARRAVNHYDIVNLQTGKVDYIIFSNQIIAIEFKEVK